MPVKTVNISSSVNDMVTRFAEKRGMKKVSVVLLSVLSLLERETQISERALLEIESLEAQLDVRRKAIKIIQRKDKIKLLDIKNKAKRSPSYLLYEENKTVIDLLKKGVSIFDMQNDIKNGLIELIKL